MDRVTLAKQIRTVLSTMGHDAVTLVETDVDYEWYKNQRKAALDQLVVLASALSNSILDVKISKNLRLVK